ncbi:hypothetical protein FRC08_006844 [Ceratobasidium sp. 394]|nr:hypothetical protein FRC08_006844 [Ceratobasidium sp. 394]
MLSDHSPNSAIYFQAFSHWKNVYNDLVSSLDHFLNESRHLDSVLQQDGAHGWSALEESFAYVDAAFVSLGTWSTQIDRIRRILGRVRNRSRSLVPFNKLPTSVTVYILSLADTSCIFEYRDGHHKSLEYRPSPLANVSVASKWLRDVATGTPSLWTHIDLSVNEPHETAYMHYARSCLQYSRERPLDVHILDDTSENRRRSAGVIATLAPHAHRIASLNVGASESVMNEILVSLFGKANPCQTLGGVLQPLRVIMIDGVIPPLQNLAFHSLTVLKLSVFHPKRISPALSGFRSFLATCPELRALTLVFSQFEKGPKPPIKPVFLPKLELLDIREVETSELLWLLSCITSGSDALTLSMVPYSYMSEDDSIQLQRFVVNSNVTRLHLESVKWSSGASRIDFPTVQELALSNYDLHDNAIGCPPDMNCFPSLHTLHLLQCNPARGVLERPVDLSTVRVLYADEPSYKQLSEIAPWARRRDYPQRVSQVRSALEWPVSLA